MFNNLLLVIADGAGPSNICASFLSNAVICRRYIGGVVCSFDRQVALRADERRTGVVDSSFAFADNANIFADLIQGIVMAARRRGIILMFFVKIAGFIVYADIVMTSANKNPFAVVY